MSTATIPVAIDIEEVSRIAGAYLHIVSDDAQEDAAGDYVFTVASARMFDDETYELAELVATKRVSPEMIPYHFADFGFQVAVATLNLPPREAAAAIKEILAEVKSALRHTIDDAKINNLDMEGKPL
jgi:hypothetical protein